MYRVTKIAKELKQRDGEESACRKTVPKAMNELGIRSKTSRKAFCPATTAVDLSQRRAVGCQHSRSRVRRDGSESEVGDRHHLSGDVHQLGSGFLRPYWSCERS